MLCLTLSVSLDGAKLLTGRRALRNTGRYWSLGACVCTVALVTLADGL